MVTHPLPLLHPSVRTFTNRVKFKLVYPQRQSILLQPSLQRVFTL